MNQKFLKDLAIESVAKTSKQENWEMQQYPHTIHKRVRNSEEQQTRLNSKEA